MTGTPDLDELYDASYRRLVVQLYAVCGDLADAEDAVQEAFVTALRKRGDLARVANPEAWVRTVALNRLRGGWRHAAVVRRYQGRVPGPQGAVEVGPEHVAIVTALAEVDEEQRHVVVLHYLAGIGMPYGCRMGICHTCTLTLVSGRVRDLRSGDEYAQPNEQVQTCITAAVGDCTLDI